MRDGESVPDGALDARSTSTSRALEERSGKRFGDPPDPLLVSVRSGAAISMPGMMDTILNLGLNDVAVEGLAAATGNPRFAYDSYRRLIQMYGEVVDGVDGHRFEGALQDLKARRGRPARRRARRADDLRELIATFQAIYEGEVGRAVPAGRRGSSCAAPTGRSSTRGTRRAPRSTAAPTRSRTTSARPSTSCRWCSATRARRSGTGVCFTRDPSTGEARLYGEFLVNAQGEDVVAGHPHAGADRADARRAARGVRRSSTATLDRLEAHYRDMQDIEFTVEEGKLFLLQTRTGKRTARRRCGSRSRWPTRG